jgi:hypothetical protein
MKPLEHKNNVNVAVLNTPQDDIRFSFIVFLIFVLFEEIKFEIKINVFVIDFLGK